jgi:histidine phosphotransferase ChpT
MALDEVKFASLLCSRLCHDLLSPVGALNNGLELLADEKDPEMRDQVLGLLSDSAMATANKLKFFRLAFGAAGGFGDMVDAREGRVAIEGLFGTNNRIEIGWLVTAPELSKPAMKVLLNLAMIAGDALVRGGRLDIGAELSGGRTEIVVRGEGDRIAMDAEIRRALVAPAGTDDIAARGAAAWLANRIVAATGGSIQVSEPDAPFLLFGATLQG